MVHSTGTEYDSAAVTTTSSAAAGAECGTEMNVTSEKEDEKNGSDTMDKTEQLPKKWGLNQWRSWKERNLWLVTGEGGLGCIITIHGRAYMIIYVRCDVTGKGDLDN